MNGKDDSTSVKRLNPETAKVGVEVDQKAIEEQRNIKEQVNTAKYLEDKRNADDAVRETNAQFERNLQKFIGKHSRTNEKGEVTGDAWDISDDTAKRSKEEATTAFNSEWKNAILGMLNSYCKLEEALHFSFEVNLRAPLWHQAKTALNAKFNSPTEPKPETGPVTVDTICHRISLDGDNNLDINLTRHKIPMEKEFNQIFKKLVVLWMDENGFKPGTTPETANQYFAADGSRLTLAKLKALQNDEDTSLQGFLGLYSKLSYEAEEPELTAPRLSM